MSVQLAKSSGGNATPGRRTPSLSLNTQGKSNAGASSAGNKSPAVANTNITEKNDKNEKSIGNNDTAAAGTVSVAPENSTKSDSNQKSSVEMKKDEVAVVQENGHYTNGHKKTDKVEENKKNVASESSSPTQVRESQRNKEKKQQKKGDDEKVIAENIKKTEATPKSGGEKTIKKQEKDNNNKEDIEKKKIQTDKKHEKIENSMAKNETAKKQESKTSQNIEEKKLKQESVEPIKKDEKKKQESKTEDDKKIQDTKKSGASTKDSRRPSNNGENQLTEQQQIDDIEPLVFEGEGEIHGHPDASSTPGKVLKHRQGPLKGEEKQQQQQQKQNNKDDLPLKSTLHSYRDSPSDTSVTLPTFHSSISRPGRISGRRSIRNLHDISFENRYPGSYRQIPDDDRWTSSMNVTVGSEIPNESTSTSSFSFFGRGKKRERTPPQSTTTRSVNQIMGSQDSELSPKSPKRARLDFSGLFGMMTSPMTMLRQKFSRAKIQSSSTPNNKEEGHNIKNKKNVITCEMTEEEDVVVNVSGIINDEITSVELAVNELSAATGEINDGDANVIVVEDSIENVEIGIEKDALELQSNEKLIDGEGDDDIHDKESQDLSATSMESGNKRKMCNLM